MVAGRETDPARVKMTAKIYVVSLGPGGRSQMTERAVKALEACDVITGYNVYIDDIGYLKSIGFCIYLINRLLIIFFSIFLKIYQFFCRNT